MPRTAKKPSYLKHKGSGQARTIIDGKTYYLGAFGSPESKERYDELCQEWLAKQGKVDGVTLTVDTLCLAYLKHADEFYRTADGAPTSEPGCIRHAERFLVAAHGTTRVRAFGPLALKAVRKAMIDAGLSRTTINKHVHRIRRILSWGVENELVPSSVYEALRRVPSLKAGRCEAREPEPIRPVPIDVVEATLAHLPRTLQSMARLQLLSGCRPGEVCSLRPCDITFGADGVWTYRPPIHKNSHRGQDRRIFFGPQSQEVLRPFLQREPEEHCFRPIDSETERNAARRARRQSAMTPSQLVRRPKIDRQRKPGDRYTKDSYCRAILRACEAADVESWSPNRLRHSRATSLRQKYGIEAAQVVLGHSDPGTTLIYAERDFVAAANIMREIG